MTTSIRQQAIYDCWENENCNILANAVAGSGKTTTILGILRRCEYRTLFLAFNKSIQEEIQAKLEAENLAQGKAMTIHSLGLSAIKSRHKFKIVKSKNWDLWKDLEVKCKAIISKIDYTDKLRLGYTLMDMNDISRLFLTNDLKEIEIHMIGMDKSMLKIDQLQELWDNFVKIREKSYEGRFIDIDFIDMIYLPVIEDLSIPVRPTYLMIDECQDLNLCQHKLIDKLISQGVEKWVAVGDRNQAIYGFSGASGNSFDLFLEKGNVKELPLDVCYRCPPNIVEEANEVYNIMQAFKEQDGIVEETEWVQGIKPNSMIICRNSGPLIKLFFELISLGKSAYIKGDDIIGSITRFLSPYKKMSLTRAKMEMEDKMMALRQKGEEESYQLFKFKENYDNFCLTAMNLCDDEGTVDGLLLQINKIFESKNNAIMLCTIHKSKGLESDVVYILNEDLIPSRFASSTQQLTQERNLKYVARTRAKKELYYLKN
jgi:superfamily I DNA/RNA helicase